MHVRRCLARAGGRTARDHRPPSARPPITSSPTPLTSTLLLRCATLPTLHCCCCRAVRHSSCCSRSACCSRAARAARTAGTARSRSPTRPPCTPSHSSSSSSRGHGMSRLLASDGHERTAGARSARPFAAALAALATFAAAPPPPAPASTATSLSPPQTRLRWQFCVKMRCFRAKNRPGPAKPLSAGSPATPDLRLQCLVLTPAYKKFLMLMLTYAYLRLLKETDQSAALTYSYLKKA